MPAASVGHNKNLAGDARIRSGDPQKRDTWPPAKPPGMDGLEEPAPWAILESSIKWLDEAWGETS
jgi:hypothetical protein